MPLRLLLIFAILLMMPLSACAKDIITVDPNTGPAVSASSTGLDPLLQDPRLDCKITYQAKRVSLDKITDALSEQTGVTIRAGYNNNDWQVRARRMSIYVTDIPLRELMQSIARVMQFKWSVTEHNGALCYRVYLDRRTLAAARAQQAASDARFEAEVRRRHEKLYSDVMGLANVSADDLEKLKSEKPYLYYVEKTGAGAFMRGLFNDCPEAKRAMLEGEAVYPDVSKLSPHTQQLMVNAARGRAQSRDREIPDDMEANASQAWLSVYCKPSFYNMDKANRLYDLGGIMIRYGPDIKTYGIASLCDPDSALANLEAKIDMQLADKSISGDDVAKLYKDDLITRYEELQSLVKECNPGEPLIEHPDENWMHDNIKLTLQEDQTKLRDTQEALARETGLSIVSDCFITTPGLYQFGDEEHEIGSVLKHIEELSYYNWEKHGSILEFRSRDWFLKRDLQVPDEWVEHWSEDTEKSGQLSLDNLAQISTLSDDQFAENLSADKVLGSRPLYNLIASSINRCRDILGLYRVLAPQQKKALKDGAGVDLRSVTPEQEVWVRRVTDITKDYGPNMPWSDDPQLMLYTRYEDTEKEGYVCHMDLVATGDYKTWMTLHIPKYEPPKETEENASK